MHKFALVFLVGTRTKSGTARTTTWTKRYKWRIKTLGYNLPLNWQPYALGFENSKLAPATK